MQEPDTTDESTQALNASELSPVYGPPAPPLWDVPDGRFAVARPTEQNGFADFVTAIPGVDLLAGFAEMKAGGAARQLFRDGEVVPGQGYAPSNEFNYDLWRPGTPLLTLDRRMEVGGVEMRLRYDVGLSGFEPTASFQLRIPFKGGITP